MRVKLLLVLCVLIACGLTRQGQAQRSDSSVSAPGNSQSSPVLAEGPDLSVQVGHKTIVSSFAYSPNGDVLASGSWDQTIILWKVSTGKQIRVFRGHFDKVRAVAISGDGKKLASTSSGRDRSIRIWDIKTGKLLKTFSVKYNLASISFSNDGHYLAGLDDALGLIFMWDAMTGRELHPTFDSRATSIAFSPKEQILASAAKYFDSISLFDPRTAKLIRTLKGHEGIVQAISFSQDGRVLASGGDDKTVRLWNVKTGKPIAALKGYTRQIQAVALSLDKDKVFSLEDDGSVKVGDIKTGKITKLLGKNLFDYRAVFSPDGKTLAERADRQSISLWNLATGEAPLSLTGYPGRVLVVTFNPSNNTIAISNQYGVAHLWNINTDGKPRLLTNQNNPDDTERQEPNVDEMILRDSRRLPSAPIAFSPGGEFVSTPAAGGTVHLWDFESGKMLPANSCPTCYTFAFDARGNILALETYPDIGDLFHRFELSSEGRKLGTPNIKAWGITGCNGPACASLPRALSVPITNDLSISSDKKMAATIGPAFNIPMVAFGFPQDRVSDIPFEYTWTKVNYPLRFLDMTTGETVRTVNGETFGLITPSGVLAGNANCVSFSSTRNILAVGGGLFDKGHIDLWDPVTGQLLRTLTEEAQVNAVVFNPIEGNILASATERPDIILWDVSAYKRVGVLKGHTDAVLSIAYSSDGKYLLSGSRDNTVKVWDVKSRREIASIIMLGGSDWMVTTPEGLFDTSGLEENHNAYWLMRDDPFNPLPIEIFMRDYYTPGLLNRIFRGKLPRNVRPLATLNRVRPSVKVLEAVPEKDAADKVSVTVEIIQGMETPEGNSRSIESGAYDLRLFRDGRLAGQWPSLKSDFQRIDINDSQARLDSWRTNNEIRLDPVTGKRTHTFHNIQLPQRAGVKSVEFTAYAFNKDRVKSATSPPYSYPVVSPSRVVQPRAYIIRVGVDANQSGWNLDFAAQSAEDMRQTLHDKLSKNYELVDVQLLSTLKPDDFRPELTQATKENIRAVLDLLAGKSVNETLRREVDPANTLRAATPDDLVLLFISSHGYSDPGGNFFVIPYDTGRPAGISEVVLNTCLSNMEQSDRCKSARTFLERSISSDDLAQWWQEVDGGEMIMILDSCHSAAVPGREFRPGPLGDPGFGQLSYDKGMLILTATQPDKTALATLRIGTGRSLLSDALIKSSAVNPQQTIEVWLREAEKQVPRQYKRLFPEAKDEDIQLPILLDFSRRKPNLSL